MPGTFGDIDLRVRSGQVRSDCRPTVEFQSLIPTSFPRQLFRYDLSLLPCVRRSFPAQRCFVALRWFFFIGRIGRGVLFMAVLRFGFLKLVFLLRLNAKLSFHCNSQQMRYINSHIPLIIWNPSGPNGTHYNQYYTLYRSQVDSHCSRKCL